MKKIISICVLYIFNLFIGIDCVDAYSTSVHIEITDRVVNQNIIKLNESINDYTGLTKGVDEFINKKKIIDWLKDGSWMEDVGYDIATSHYYEPISNKGYSVLGVEIGQSAYDRANDPTNSMSWIWARNHFYEALTTTFNGRREPAFADTFRALGQVMHLVQDVAVPAHTRNDFHFPAIDGEPYEAYIGKIFKRLNYTSIPFQYWNALVSQGAPKQFWDLESYNGSVAYDSGYIGLAEYTSANFFSQDTIFKDFPHPARENTNFEDFGLLPITVITTPGGINHNTFYISGYGKKYLAAMKYFAAELFNSPIPLPIKKYELTPTLDNRCHEEYAQKLIPRAVGYSAGLLDYFFRGTLEISAPDAYVYSVIDGSVVPQQFTKIKAKVRNTTPNEQVQNGIIQAVARYKIIPNYAPYLSNYPPDGTTMHGIPYSYSVSAPITITSLSSTTPTEFTFDFTNSPPIPAGITDLSLQVIFKGTLGNETDNAIAVGMKDLMEPAHHVLWNLTDMFSLDGHLYIAGDIRNDPRVAGVYIDPHDINFEFAYMGESPPASSPIISATVALPAGRHIRLLVLVDRQDNNYVRIRYSSVPYPNEKYGDVFFQGVTNQEVNGTWQATPVNVFRTVRGHLSQGVIACVPYPNDGVCPYPEEEAIPVADLTPYPANISFPAGNISANTLDFRQALRVQTRAEAGIGQGEGFVFIGSNSQELTKTSKQTNPEKTTDLTPPDITIAVPTKDNLGNTDTVPYSASITLDTTAPVLTVSTLSDGSWTNNELLNVSGQVTDNTGIQQLTINDVAVAINPDGSFSYPVVLQDGPNIVGIRVTDLAGNEASDMRTINLDQDAPVITIATPADNMNTKQSWIDITGTVDDQSTVTVEVNAANPMAALMNGNNFSLTVALVYGINTIEVTATDFAGNTSTVKRTVTFDDQNPSLSVTYPAQDIKTNQSTITIRGEVTDLTVVTITVTMDGNIYTPAVTSGRFEQTVTFTEGKTYQIYVKAVDEAGNETLVQRNVVYDTTAPSVTLDPVTSPTNLN